MAIKKDHQSDVSLTVKEVAELDNCSQKTVRRAIACGELPAFRIGPGGRVIRVLRSAHDAYRRQRRL